MPKGEPIPANADSFGYGINDYGIVVGSYRAADHRDDAFMFEGSTMRELNSPIGPSAWFLTDAHDINNAGQIVGSGIFNGHRHAFRLDPLIDTDFVATRFGGHPGDPDHQWEHCAPSWPARRRLSGCTRGTTASPNGSSACTPDCAGSSTGPAPGRAATDYFKGNPTNTVYKEPIPQNTRDAFLFRLSTSWVRHGSLRLTGVGGSPILACPEFLLSTCPRRDAGFARRIAVSLSLTRGAFQRRHRCVDGPLYARELVPRLFANSRYPRAWY